MAKHLTAASAALDMVEAAEKGASDQEIMQTFRENLSVLKAFAEGEGDQMIREFRADTAREHIRRLHHALEKIRDGAALSIRCDAHSAAHLKLRLSAIVIEAERGMHGEQRAARTLTQAPETTPAGREE